MARTGTVRDALTPGKPAGLLGFSPAGRARRVGLPARLGLGLRSGACDEPTRRNQHGEGDYETEGAHVLNVAEGAGTAATSTVRSRS